MKYQDKLYYTNELNDEVVDFNIKTKKIDKKYHYIHKNPFYRLGEFLSYHLIAKPIVWFYVKCQHIKFVNRKALKQCKTSYFVYSNHTQPIMDAFHPTYTCYHKKPHLICHANNVSSKFIGKLAPMWGAIPLPDTIDATRNFNAKLEHVLCNNNPIIIYPERHLWPYYTKIRSFDTKSFRYPVKYEKPIYTFTTTYTQRKSGKKPQITIYVDGPFQVDSTLPLEEQRQQLRDWAYQTMCSRAKNSTYDYCQYIKRIDKQPQKG